MTDKEIIIDGVDVSGCERHCSDNRNNPNMCYSEMTRTYSNCNPKEKQCNFYITSIEKQLKRKEQECDMWKNLTVDNGAVALKYQQQLDQLKATNEDLLSIQYKLADNNKRLRQTLDEIKEIAEFYANSTVGDKQEDGTFKVDLEKCTKSGTTYFTYDPRPANQILQKISEVLDE